MATKDLIADGLTAIRNGLLAKKDIVTFSTNKAFISIVEILKEGGYIKDYSIETEGLKKTITIKLKYNEKGLSVISKLERISKCSRRVYSPADEVPRIANGYATVIVSTSKGIMTGKKAKSINQGGEVLCYVM